MQPLAIVAASWSLASTSTCRNIALADDAAEPGLAGKSPRDPRGSEIESNIGWSAIEPDCGTAAFKCEAHAPVCGRSPKVNNTDSSMHSPGACIFFFDATRTHTMPVHRNHRGQNAEMGNQHPEGLCHVRRAESHAPLEWRR